MFIITSAQKHLKRYLAEFDFHHNERAAFDVADGVRAARLIRGMVGETRPELPLGGGTCQADTQKEMRV